MSQMSFEFSGLRKWKKKKKNLWAEKLVD
jgi:hypothetical protein